MAYCSLTDLTRKIPELEIIRLTDDSNSGEVDLSVVSEAIDAATNEINAWLGSRLKLPIESPVPAILVDLAAKLAIYELFNRAPTEVPEKWIAARKDSIGLLRAFSNGDVTLGVEPPLDSPEEYSGGAKVYAPPKIFGSDTMDQF